MFDDFFVRALLAGTGVAMIAGPLGCFIIWRRLAYFGDTLSHASLLGVAIALSLQVNIVISVFVLSVCLAIALLSLRRRARLSEDSILGILSHSGLALGILVLASMEGVRVDLMGLLFGDILSVSKHDLLVIYVGGFVVLLSICFIWKSLFAATVSYELAKVEGMKPDFTEIIYILLLAGVIAVAIKIVGILLITAMLIIPAATARRFSSGPEQMALVASILGALAAGIGLFGSLIFDTPSGPSIVMTAFLLFILSLFRLPR